MRHGLVTAGSDHSCRLQEEARVGPGILLVPVAHRQADADRLIGIEEREGGREKREEDRVWLVTCTYRFES